MAWNTFERDSSSFWRNDLNLFEQKSPWVPKTDVSVMSLVRHMDHNIFHILLNECFVSFRNI